MKEQIISHGTPLKGHVLGYAKDDICHIAILNVEGDAVQGCEFIEFRSPHMAMAYLVERPMPLGIGMPAILALGTGKSGLRPADYWIHQAPFHVKDEHDEFPFDCGPFHMSPYESWLCLCAIALLCGLRRRWPQLPATETAPEETYPHLARCAARTSLEERMATLGRWLKTALPAPGTGRDDRSKAKWRAAMSAYAMWMGLRGAWPINLHALAMSGGTSHILTGSIGGRTSTEESFEEPALDEKTLIFPAGPGFFFWPPEERAE